MDYRPAGATGPWSYDAAGEGDETTDNFITCPLLQLKHYSRSRKPITSRLGHKARSLKHNKENQTSENKTSEADLGNSFLIHRPKKLISDTEELDSNDPQFFRTGVKAQNDFNLETPSDTFVNLNIDTVRRFKPKIPFSLKRTLFSNKENLMIQSKDLKTSEPKHITQNNTTTSSCLLTTKENIKDIVIKSPVNIKDDTLFETSKYNYDSSLYHSVREAITIPDPSYSSISYSNSHTLIDSDLSLQELECQPLNDQLGNIALDLTSTAKQDNVRSQSPTCPSPVEFVQEQACFSPVEFVQEQACLSPVEFVQEQACPSPVEFVQEQACPSPVEFVQKEEEEEDTKPVIAASSLCVKCAHGNCISVRGINYSILNTLGHGGSSIVYEVLHPNTNQVVAIKKVDLSEVDDVIAKGYLNEVDLLQNLQDCENVIHLFDSEYTTKERMLYMVMERGDTDLSKLIRSTKHMSVHMIMYYWSEMLTTVNEVHAKGVIHSDLKPANFLLVSGRLKLIDFGIASKIQGDMTSVLKHETSGTWNYMSPECIRSGGSSFQGHKINQKSDVWSLGCILYSLIYGKTPYSHLTNTWQKLHAIAESKQNINFPSCSKLFTQGIPPVLMKTMNLCLTKEVKARPYVADLLSLIENVYITYNSMT